MVTQEVDRETEDFDPFTEMPFTSFEVSKAIRKLHRNKGCGYDNVSS